MTSFPHIDTYFSSLIDVIKARLDEVLHGRESRHEKNDGSYVTSGDLLMQRIVMDLAAERLPGVRFVSEELATGEQPPPAADSLLLVLDPIDGTENFTSGLPEWGVSVSCYQGSSHLASLIGCPELNLWLRTGGDVQRFKSRIRGLSSSLSMEELIKATQGYEYRILGCCVYNMINVVRGSFQAFENPKGANSWDILAGLNLAIEHGLHVSVEGKTYAGEYLPPTSKYRFKIENR
jgi:fructose-1,6-bisphosphatase/inositol monophosphatase family enzyme